MSGHFELCDEFTSTELALYFNVIRTPRERWYDLTSTPGSLTVRARAVDLESLDQPSSQGSADPAENRSARRPLRLLLRDPGRSMGAPPGDVDGTVLSTRVAGGSVGTYFGMRAYGGAPRGPSPPGGAAPPEEGARFQASEHDGDDRTET